MATATVIESYVIDFSNLIDNKKLILNFVKIATKVLLELDIIVTSNQLTIY